MEFEFGKTVRDGVYHGRWDSCVFEAVEGRITFGGLRGGDRWSDQVR